MGIITRVITVVTAVPADAVHPREDLLGTSTLGFFFYYCCYCSFSFDKTNKLDQILQDLYMEEKDPGEVRFDRAARFYDTLNAFIERFASKSRREVLRQARGNILEVGVGTRSSFKDYPP